MRFVAMARGSWCSEWTRCESLDTLTWVDIIAWVGIIAWQGYLYHYGRAHLDGHHAPRQYYWARTTAPRATADRYGDRRSFSRRWRTADCPGAHSPARSL